MTIPFLQCSDIRQVETELCSAVSKLTLSNSTKLNSNAVSNISSAENEEEKQGHDKYVAVIYFLHQQFYFAFDNYAISKDHWISLFLYYSSSQVHDINVKR